jgi:hypothetical protein
MNNIVGTMRGTRVNVMINSETYSKSFNTQDDADNFFAIVLKAMKDPSDQNVSEIKAGLNIKAKMTVLEDFEYDPDSDVTTLAGFDTPVPDDLIKTVEEYINKGFPTDSIVNFWKRLMANPDKRVRQDLFKFINTHDFSLTNKGYLVVYKTVDYKEKIDHDLAEFISESYMRIKFKRKQSPTNYVVYKLYETEITTETETWEEPTGDYDLEDCDSFDEYYDEYGYEPEEIYEEMEEEVEQEDRVFQGYKVTTASTFSRWDNEGDLDIELVGKLHELQAKLDQIEDQNKSLYTDHYSHTMEIRLGTPVTKERPKCDGNPKIECSDGLHVGATKYVEKFRGWHRTNDKDSAPVLLCLVDPINVVAVPEYDNSKIRVCEYFPYAKASVTEGKKFEIVDQAYFEDDYESVSQDYINDLIVKIKEDELEIRMQAHNASADDRSLVDYAKILEARLTDL